MLKRKTDKTIKYNIKCENCYLCALHQKEKNYLNSRKDFKRAEEIEKA